MSDTAQATDSSTAFLEAPRAITCEREFLEAIRARREELQMGYEAIEALADMPERSACKLFTGRKPIGALTLWQILGALAYRIVLEEDPERLARNQRHREWVPLKRKSQKRWNLSQIAIARRRNAPWLFDGEKARENGKKGGLKKAIRQRARAHRAQQNRLKALKRWHKPQLIEITEEKQ